MAQSHYTIGCSKCGQFAAFDDHKEATKALQSMGANQWDKSRDMNGSPVNHDHDGLSIVVRSGSVNAELM